jgi:CRP-like cAMP-binding protein
LQGLGAIRTFPAHADIVRPGQAADHAVLVLAGLVAQFSQNRRGERQVTALYVPGDLAGACLGCAPAQGSAMVTLGESTLLMVPAAALHDLVPARPAIARVLWSELLGESRIMAQWLVNIGTRDAMTRVAHLLCELAWRHGEAPRDGRVAYQLAMTQRDLAETTGLTSVHVNRTLKRLEAWGLSFRHKTVRIDDWSALARRADFDPGYLQARPVDRRPWRPDRASLRKGPPTAA